MAETDLKDLVRRTPFSFVGTIEYLGAATSGDLTIDKRTAVVRVDLVLHAVGAFDQLQGHRVTVQFAADTDPPAVGEQLTIFAEALSFGQTVAVAEVARAPVAAVRPHVERAAGRGGRRAFAPLEQQLADEELREHAHSADAVVVGTVVALMQASTRSLSEHDPLWWRATIDVRQVIRGPVEPGPLGVLYPNSLDTQWARVPKPEASQDGVWILHRVQGDLVEFAGYRLEHENDRQPVSALAAIVDYER